jgi:hypothetical protein
MKRLLFGIAALSMVAVVTLFLSLARAQQPSPSTGRIPQTAPHGWKQSDWNIMLARCLQVFAEFNARQYMTAEQLKNIQPFSTRDSEEIEACLHMAQGGAPKDGAQGSLCSDDAECAPGFSCFRTGAPWNIHYCTAPSPPLWTDMSGGRAFPAKTCKTASDCGPGDWSCSGGGVCQTTGE